MKIQKAFEKDNDIVIDYVFLEQCEKCCETFENIDEEYSYEGNVEYFTGEWQREYGVMDLEVEVTEIGDAHYKFVCDTTHERFICDKCNSSDCFVE